MSSIYTIINDRCKRERMNTHIESSAHAVRRAWWFVQQILHRYHRYHVTEYAAQIAFYLLLSIFPFLILLINLLGLIGRISFLDQRLIGELSGLVPEAVLTLVNGILQDILRDSSWTLASFSFLGVIFAASNGLAVILRSLLKIYDVKKQPHYFKLRGIGLIMTVLLSFAILLSMLLIGFGDALLHQLAVLTGLPMLTGALLRLSRYLFSLLFLALFFSGLYHFVGRSEHRYRQALPGALFAAVAWLFFAQVFSFYVQSINNFTRLYGSLGGMIIVMLWLYYDCVVILTGGILNVALQERQQQRAVRKQAALHPDEQLSGPSLPVGGRSEDELLVNEQYRNPDIRK